MSTDRYTPGTQVRFTTYGSSKVRTGTLNGYERIWTGETYANVRTDLGVFQVSPERLST